MKASKEFNDILNECLERLLFNDETIEQCLEDYPEKAGELGSLLKVAIAAKRMSTIQPSLEFRTKARYQLRSLIQEEALQRSRSLIRWFPRWAAVLTLVIGLITIGGGTVAAASYSMPDEPLYPVKLSVEQVQLTLTRSYLNKARLCAVLADRRVTEIVYLADKGNAQKVEIVIKYLNRRLAKLTELALAVQASSIPKSLAQVPALPSTGETGGSRDIALGTNGRIKLRATLVYYAINHPAALRAVLDRIPESAKPALNEAIALSVANYEEAIRALG